MREISREILNRMNEKYAPEQDFTKKPVEYLNYIFERTTFSFSWDGGRIIALMRWNFNAVKEKYKFSDNFAYHLKDFMNEKEYYQRNKVHIFPKMFPLTLLWDDHASLQVALQCDVCGTIIHIDEGDESCLMRPVCPACNNLDEESSIFSYVTTKDKIKWINQMLYAEIVDGDKYLGGEYSNCKFKPNTLEKSAIKFANRITNKFLYFKRFLLKKFKK